MLSYSFVQQKKYLVKTVALLIWLLLCFYNGYIYLVSELGGNIGFRLNELTLSVIVETNFTEASEFLDNDISHTLISFLLKYCLIPLLVILILPINNRSQDNYFFTYKKLADLFKTYTKFILFVFSCIPLIVVFFLGREQEILNILHENPLFQMAYITSSFFKHRYNFFEKHHHIFHPVHLQDSSTDDLIVVFFFGESARGDRFSLNGYTRETNPLLKKQKNLISFKNAHSCRTSTNLSFNCVMQGYNSSEFVYDTKAPTLFSYFKKAGFDTAYLSTGATDLSEYLQEDFADIFIKMNKSSVLNQYAKTHDYELVSMLDNFINSSTKSKFITLTGMGSHHNYEQRVPAEFQKFKTTDEKLNHEIIQHTGPHCYVLNGKTRGFVNDAYDATILYTDYVINAIIEKLKDKNAIFIYASDHGESFGEKGTSGCLHAYRADDEQIWHIPFLFWASNKFIENHPEKWKNIKTFEKQVIKRERMISHDNIAHTLLDCASIESDFIDKRLSLCTQEKPIFENKFEGMKRFSK